MWTLACVMIANLVPWLAPSITKGNADLEMGWPLHETLQRLGLGETTPELNSTQSQSVSSEDLMEVRRVLEVQIARLAAERATPEGIEELERNIASWRHVLEYHVASARLSQNSLSGTKSESLADAVYEARQLACKLPGVTREATDLHQGILDEMKARDPEGAARAISKHLDQSRRVTLEGI